MIDVLIEELTAGLPDAREFARVALRLVVAMALGAAVGYERERVGKSAGLRTHMLVAMGAALFVLVPLHDASDVDAVSRVIQGVATGIGFIGAGAILKRHDRGEVEGLTTAAGVWMTAAVGVAVGAGQLGIALVSVVLTVVTLGVVGRTEGRARDRQP